MFKAPPQEHCFKEEEETECDINVASFRFDNRKLLKMYPDDKDMQAVVTQEVDNTGINGKWTHAIAYHLV